MAVVSLSQPGKLVVLGRLCAAVVLGALWNAGWAGIALSPLLIGLWRTADARWEAGAIASLYFASAAAPALTSVMGRGYADVAPLELVGVAALAAMIMGAWWAVLWSAACRACSLATLGRVAAVLVVPALPGLGVIGVANPITAAGVYFAGTGWLGLVGLIILVACFPVRPLARAGATAALAVLATVHGAPQEALGAAPASIIEGRDTRLPVPSELRDFVAQFGVALSAQAEAAAPPFAGTLVLPEGVAGLWTEEMRELWEPSRARAQRAGERVLVGGTLPVYSSGGRVLYDNVALVLGGSRPEVVRQRVPLPGVMWRPWRDRETYRAHLFEHGTTTVQGTRVGVVICYEQMLVFPTLWSVASGARALVGMANLRAVPSDAVARWQAAALRAWGSLFSIPVISAVNR